MCVLEKFTRRSSLLIAQYVEQDTFRLCPPSCHVASLCIVIKRGARKLCSDWTEVPVADHECKFRLSSTLKSHLYYLLNDLNIYLVLIHKLSIRLCHLCVANLKLIIFFNRWKLNLIDEWFYGAYMRKDIKTCTDSTRNLVTSHLRVPILDQFENTGVRIWR